MSHASRAEHGAQEPSMPTPHPANRIRPSARGAACVLLLALVLGPAGAASLTTPDPLAPTLQIGAPPRSSRFT
jgi:hypothetical protein